MSSTTSFHYAGPGGPVSGTALAAFVARVPGDGINIWLKRFEGYVLGCDSVEVSNHSAGATLRLRGLKAVVGGHIVIEDLLECSITGGQTDVYLVVAPTPKPLDPEIPGGLQALVARGVLMPDPGDRLAILAAKCKWAKAEQKSDASLEATPNRSWWPDLLRVADHPFSLAAAGEFRRLIGELPAHVAFDLAAAQRGEEISWLRLIHDILEIAVDRFRDRPERAAELAQLAEQRGQADLVDGLIRLLRADLRSSLPATLEIDGSHYRLANPLRDVRPVQRFDQTGSLLRLDCGVAPSGGWLVVVMEDSVGGLYRVTANVNGVDQSAIRAADRDAQPLVELHQGAKVTLTISSESATPTAIGVGLYVPQVKATPPKS